MPNDKKAIAEIQKLLTVYVADTFVLYTKTLNYHWNMVGSTFFMYHRLLEEQYKEMAEGVDELAERIRMLGGKAPATLKEFLNLTTLKEGNRSHPQNKMVKELVLDNKALVKHGEAIIAYTDEHDDPGTSDLLIERIRAHDKNAWLLGSNLTSS